MRPKPSDPVSDSLRRAIYAGIRRATDESPVFVRRSVIVRVLATMAAEQAAIVAKDEQRMRG